MHGTLASDSLAHLIANPNPVSSAVALRKSSASISFLKLILRHCLDVSMSVKGTGTRMYNAQRWLSSGCELEAWFHDERVGQHRAITRFHVSEHATTYTLSSKP